MSKINTNMAGVTTLYHLRNKEEGMNKALERISSGLRLNHAVDDAAGASIVNRMTSQIKGLGSCNQKCSGCHFTDTNS